MSAFADVSGAFLREHLRARLTLALMVAIPVFFVLIFASVLGDFAAALGGTLARRSATAISAGWAAAFLSGTLAFFRSPPHGPPIDASPWPASALGASRSRGLPPHWCSPW